MATGGSDPNDSARKRGDDLRKIKAEIRSILLTSGRTGSTPQELEQDYDDINGQKMPFEKFGFRTLQDFIRSIPDVVDVRKSFDGRTKLFAKSHESTRHIETLIKKQKASRISRFGGTDKPQQRSASTSRETAQRRHLIQQRLVEIAARSNGFIRYNDLRRKYLEAYGEPFDPKVEYNTNAKTVFGGKLRGIFTLVGGDGCTGNFLFRLKDAERLNTNPGLQGFEDRSSSTASQQSRGSSFKVTVPNGRNSKRQVTIVGENYQRPQQQQFQTRGSQSSSNRRGSGRGAYGRGRFVAPRFANAPQFSASTNAPQLSASRFPAPQRPTAPTLQSPSNTSMKTVTSSAVAPKPGNVVQTPFKVATSPAVPPTLSLDPSRTAFAPQQTKRNDNARITNGRSKASFKDRVSDLLSKYPNGIEFSMFRNALIDHYAVDIGVNNDILRRECGDVCDLVWNEASMRHYVMPKQEPAGPLFSMGNLAAALLPLSLTELKERCREVLRQHPNGITYLGFPKAFKAVTGRELDLAPYNWHSVSELVDCMSDIFTTSRKAGEPLLFEAKLKSIDSVKSPSSAVRPPEQSPKDLLLDQLWYIAMKSPGRSILITQVRSAYEAAYGKPIQVDDLDKLSLELFDYTDRFDFAYEGVLQIIAQPSYQPSDPTLIETKTKPLAAAAAASLSSAAREDFVSAGEHFTIQPLPVPVAEMDSSQTFKVTVAQVESPGCLFIQLTSSQEEFEELVFQMYQYYSDSTNPIVISPSEIRADVVCACCYEDDQLWCRGIVRDVKNDVVIVTLVDFGTEVSVRLDAIYSLPRRFFQLPAQAIKCRLALLSPPSGEWLLESGDIVAQMCGSNVLWAEVERLVVSLFCNSATQTDDGGATYINDLLLEANLAVFDESAVTPALLGSAAAVSPTHEIDLENEIASDTDDSAVVEERNATDDAEASKFVSSPLDLSFEWEVIDLLKLNSLRTVDDLETIYMMKTVLSRKHATLMKMLSEECNEHEVLVDCLVWLEEQIDWLMEQAKAINDACTA